MRVLAIGAHADDMEPQMGGTIAKYVNKDYEVLMVEAIIPCEDENGIADQTRKEVRWKEAEKAAEILGAKLKILDLDPYEITYNRKLIQILDKVVKDFLPDIVYTNWNHDSHQDHKAISNATFAATRKNRGSLYMYAQTAPGGLTPYSFKPEVFVDISDFIEIKMKSVMAYESQIKIYGSWLDAIKGRSKFLGYQINVEYAEAFEVVRMIKII